jgi:uncharacterized protein (DUF58 family)
MSSLKNDVTSTTEANIYTDISHLRRLEFLAKGFDFSPKQPVNSVLSGKNASRLRGRGLNFEELRHYQPGDDIRSMDWKVTRRTGKPHIKVYTEERERNVYLVIDQRNCMFFGSVEKMKSVIAAEVAALMAWQVSSSGDRIGAVIYSDTEVHVVPPKRGRQHVVNVLIEIVKQNKRLKVETTNINETQSLNTMLAKLAHICGTNALIILISDGNGWNEQSTLQIKKIRQHNEIISCFVYDPLEQNLPQMSQMVVSDGEQQIQFSSEKASIQSKYQEILEARSNASRKMASKYRIPLILVSTIETAESQLRKAFGKVGK